MKNLWQDLVADAVIAVGALITSKAHEGLRLEFKVKSDQTGDLNKDDKRNLGEALSGFSNSDGGILIFGIETAKDGDGEFASGFKPLHPLSALQGKIESLCSEYISPPNVKIEVITITLQEDSGLIAIRIPRGENRPYMSMAPTHQKYYKRSHDRFVPLENYEVVDLVKISDSPSLECELRFMDRGSMGGNRMASLIFGVRNTSRIIAKYPFITYHARAGLPRPDRYGLDGNGNTGWPKLIGDPDGYATFLGRSDDVIHPDRVILVSQITIVDDEMRGSFRDWAIANLTSGETIVLAFEFGCEGCQTVRASYEFGREELFDRIIPPPRLS